MNTTVEDRLTAIDEQLTDLRDSAKAQEAERRRQGRALQDERAHLRSIATYEQLLDEDLRLPELVVLLHTSRCRQGTCSFSRHVAQGGRDWHQYGWELQDARAWLQVMDRAGIDRHVAIDVKRAEVLSESVADNRPLHSPDLLDPTVQLWTERNDR